MLAALFKEADDKAVLSVKGRTGGECHIVSASMLDQEEEEEEQTVFNTGDLSEMSTHLNVQMCRHVVSHHSSKWFTAADKQQSEAEMCCPA